jgi:hypothetical protein
LPHLRFLWAPPPPNLLPYFDDAEAPVLIDSVRAEGAPGDLRAEVNRAVPGAAERVVEELKRLGAAPKERAAPASCEVWWETR